MKMIELFRLLYKHRALLILPPVLMALTVVALTLHPSYTYTSETTIYTGIASGEGVGMGMNLSYFATNTSFDNLINVTKSRETKQEVAIRLLAQHLLLPKPDSKYISQKSYEELEAITPSYIRRLVVRNNPSEPDTMLAPLFPASINKKDYEQTVTNLKACMEASDTNFVYKLLNFNHPHYSLNAISSIDVTRMESSDLVRLRYDSDDPGICQQTLSMFMDACIKNYKKIKISGSDAVINYFENELAKVSARLKESENALLQFNQDNNIINYYEQSKAVAVEKESLDREYNNMRIKLAGIEASIRRIEEKLKNQNKILPKSSEIVQNRNKLAELNAKITSAETRDAGSNVGNKELVRLKIEAEKLKESLKENVNELYGYNHTTEGLPAQKLLTEWIDNVILYEDTKAGMNVLSNRIKDFQKQYATYAPAGAKMKRIEREIAVNEQEYIELLRGLGSAKLKAKDAEFTTGVKAVDQPYYPLTANPTKRKMLVVFAAFLGFFFVLVLILALEYFDNTLKNPARAVKKMKLANLGVFPKLFLKTKLLNFPFLTNRLLELMLQNLGLFSNYCNNTHSTKIILILSTTHFEGKSVLAGNLTRRMLQQGKKVLYMNYDSAEFHEQSLVGPPVHGVRKNKPYPLLSRLFGYEDTRVDFQSPFLQKPETYLGKEDFVTYKLNKSCCSVENYKELLTLNGITRSDEPDFVLIELPPLLYYPLPVNLLTSSDKVVLVCRANRVWTSADESIVNDLRQTTGKEPMFVLNGVELPVMEHVLGELPKQRGLFHRFLKNVVSMQFFNKQEI